MKTSSLVVAALVLLAACAMSAPTPAPSPFPARTGAIFAGEKARELATQCSRMSPGPVEGTWTPTQADIAALEPALGPLLEEELAREATLYQQSGQRRATAYYRQYGGLVIGRKDVIYVNGFDQGVLHDDPDHSFDWHTRAMGVCDGGSIVFGVEYDPATGMFANFAFNGSLRPPPRP